MLAVQCKIQQIMLHLQIKRSNLQNKIHTIYRFTLQKMMQFWIGNSQQYIAAEYAKSGRSVCRQCKQKIQNNQLRIGLLTDNDNFASSYWYHKNCFHFKPRHKVLQVDNLQQMICGIQDLEDKDCDNVVDYLKDQLTDLKSGKPKKKAKPNSSKKQKEDMKDQKKEEQKKQQQKPLKRTKSKQYKTQDNKDELKSSKKSNKSQKQQPALNITSKHQAQYQKLLEKYNQKSAVELKEILGKNNQSKTGSKPELAAKCADGKQFGRIPGCQKCGGGKLRFDRNREVYKCPGYMQDTDFVHCGAQFKFQEIKRGEWIE